MSLFTSQRDRDMDLLSQVFQLNFNDPAEIIDFILLRSAWPGEQQKMDWKAGIKSDARLLSVFSAWVSGPCQLARRIMTSLAGANPGIMKDDAQQLISWLKDSNLWPTRGLLLELPEGRLDDWRNGEFIPIAFVKRVTDFPGYIEDLIGRIITDIADLVESYGRGVSTLKHCERCRNIFVSNPSQPRQKFCSHRCANLAVQQRQRKSVKIDPNEVRDMLQSRV